MASLPDYDPNDPVDALKPDRLNRMSAGVYELGSVFKSFTFAMALDSGKWKLSDSVDASHDLRIGHFTIHDFHAKHRVLTLPEVFTFSSNIGAARMALRVGADGQRAYYQRFGLLSKPTIELPETVPPIVPSRWSDLTTATAAFGHGARRPTSSRFRSSSRKRALSSATFSSSTSTRDRGPGPRFRAIWSAARRAPPRKSKADAILPRSASIPSLPPSPTRLTA